MKISSYDHTQEAPGRNFIPPQHHTGENPMSEFIHLPALKGSGSGGDGIGSDGESHGGDGDKESESDNWAYFFSLYVICAMVWAVYFMQFDLTHVIANPTPFGLGS